MPSTSQSIQNHPITSFPGEHRDMALSPGLPSGRFVCNHLRQRRAERLVGLPVSLLADLIAVHDNLAVGKLQELHVRVGTESAGEMVDRD